MPILGQVVAALVPVLIDGVTTTMGKASRDKGARGEREIVRLLTPCVPFGWTVRRALPYELGHDLRIVDERGDAVPGGWAIEVKRYGGFTIGEVMRGPSSRWLDWWAQAARQADEVGRAPMLLTRGDRRPWWVWTREAIGGDGLHIEFVVDGQTVCGTSLEAALADGCLANTEAQFATWPPPAPRRNADNPEVSDDGGLSVRVGGTPGT
jgi:hypothetical protein